MSNSPNRRPKSTAIADRLREWLWSQRPPVDGVEFARRLNASQALGGVGKVRNTSVWNWVTMRPPIIPSPRNLAAIAEVTRTPLAEWYEMAGIPMPAPPQSQLDAAIKRLRTDERFSVKEREAMADYFRQAWVGIDPLAARHREESEYGQVIEAGAAPAAPQYAEMHQRRAPRKSAPRARQEVKHAR